jgi:hypothetical protein
VKIRPPYTGKYRSEYKTLSLNGKNYSLHRIVALTFIPNPENKDTVNHKDGNKLNNAISNLEWLTNKENIQHGFNSGLYQNSKTEVSQYTLSRNYLNTFKSLHEAERIKKSLLKILVKLQRDFGNKQVDISGQV